MNKQKQAFTLIELIVVITILAILGTIAFISLQSYSALSRDSVRISDVSKIKSTLELFSIDTLKYPNTTDGTAVTFSGETIWTQGIFGEDTFKNVSRLDKIPKDPLTEKEYIYSITNTKQEYELASLMEGDVFSMTKESYAADKTARVMITGHYNGKIAKVFADNKIYVLAVPTIISASGITIESIMLNNTFAYNGYKNLPFLYNGTSYNTLGETGLNLVNPNEYIVYSGSLSVLKDSDDSIARIAMLQGLQAAYTGTITGEQNSTIAEILAIEIINGSNGVAVSLAGNIVNNTFGSRIQIEHNVLIDGVCGIDNNGDFTTEPINLCGGGNASNVTDNGEGFTYDWTCDGVNGGNQKNCSANHSISLDPYCGISNQSTYGGYFICDGGLGDASVKVAEHNTSTGCPGYYKTYRYTTGGVLSAIFISNGHCAGTGHYFYDDPAGVSNGSTGINDECIEWGGTGNYKWRYYNGATYVGTTLGVLCEI